MTTYELLEQKTYDNDILLLTNTLPPCINGYYCSNADYHLSTITINKHISTSCERCSVLAEELGHHFTTPVDLFSASKDMQDKYEHRACVWAACELVPLHKLISAWLAGVRSAWDLADYLDITEPFLHQALQIHQQHYGQAVKYKQYQILFDPLNIYEEAC